MKESLKKEEMELKTAVKSYLLAKGQQHSQAKRAAAEAAQSVSAPIMSAEATAPVQKKSS
jgi:hypothetical protein